MRYLSVCSGIEAATVAWHPLGWSPFGFAEIEAFPSAVLAHHYGSNLPGEKWSGNATPNFGDMTKFEEWPDAAVDVFVGGTPCQDYSIAGLRAGMDGIRGSLTLTFAAIARKYRSRWLVWENVPGVLSSNQGRDFGKFLGLLAGRSIEVPAGGWQSAGIVPGYGRAYGLAWRVLDAQYIRVDGFARAVPQRRRRVFIVGYLGDWRRAAAVLFERESLCGNPPPRRQAGQAIAGTLAVRAGGGGRPDGGDGRHDQLIASTGDISHCLNAGGMARQDFETETMIAQTVAGALGAGDGERGWRNDLDQGAFIACPVADSLAVGANQTTGFESDVVAHALRAEGFDASEDGTGRGTPIMPVIAPEIAQTLTRGAESAGKGGYAGRRQEDDVNIIAMPADVAGTLKACGGKSGQPNGAEEADRLIPLAFDMRGREGGAQFEGPHETANIRAASGGSSKSYIAESWAVRRLMPVECERLQGFPDNYTLIASRGKPAADGPRYKALGNSMAVNVMRWIGQRIAAVDAIEVGE